MGIHVKFFNIQQLFTENKVLFCSLEFLSKLSYKANYYAAMLKMQSLLQSQLKIVLQISIYY